MAKNPIDIVRQVEETWDSGKLDELDGFFAADFSSESAVPMLPPGLEGAKIAHQMGIGAMPDRKTEILDIFSDGKKVCARLRMTGTNRNGMPWLGAPANDAKVDIQWISIYEVDKGKITKAWGINDGTMLLAQLGVWAPPKM